MSERVNKEDQLISGIMKDYEMSNPPADFTAKVMDRIELESVTPGFVSTPLISRAGWIGISISVIILILIILLGSSGESSSQSWLFENLAWNFSLPQINLEKWRIIDFSNSTLTWIILGSGGIILLALIEKWIEENRFRQTLFL
ncbi:MAG: hypothetical protein KAT31_08960 [Bacteroidales bacterium]|nr:hypothetical protein [Bacteroidales bacterium]